MASQEAAFSLELAPDAILVIDSDRQIVFANQQAASLFGYSKDELLERPVEYLLPEGMESSSVTHANARFQQRSPAPVGVHRDGTRFLAALKWKAAVLNGNDYIVLSMQKTEEGSQRGAPDPMLQQQLDVFSLFNHDVRQSLQSIQFICDSLAETAPDRASNISEIVGSVKSLLDTILRLNDAGTIKAEEEHCRLGDLLHALRRELGPVAQRKGLRLDIDHVDEEIRTDPVLLRELLQNLVANAIRYTEEGTVEVRCRPSPTSICIDVTDTGIGMAGSQLEGVLVRARGSMARVQPGGGGLGLAIAQRLADVLGCRIEAQSIPGVGSTFSVTAPRTGARRDPMRVSRRDTSRSESEGH